MKPRFTSLKQVLDIFGNGENYSISEIMSLTGKGRTLIHRYVKELVDQGKLKKIGNPPHSKYHLSKVSERREKIGDLNHKELDIDFKTRKLVDEIFFKFSPTGKKLEGIEGIQTWCRERNIDVSQKIQDYIKFFKYIESQQDICGMLEAHKAFGKDFENIYLDQVIYADQYIYGEFGRGKLAELTFYAKQSQNKNLIQTSISEIMPKLECHIMKNNYDALAITPWSIKRQNQLLGELKKKLSVFELPFVNIIKYSESGIFIPQKSLKTRDQRIENAKNTIFIDDKNIGKYNKILLLDDFVGSGATLNETAKKLKQEGVQHVTGFAFVGNTDLKFEVINEI